MLFMHRKKLELPAPTRRFPAAPSACRCPSATSSTAPRSSRPSRRGLNRPCSGWAASGAPSASSGRRRASTRPRSATPAASRRTRPTRRCAPAGPATPRSCSSSSIRSDVSYDELLRVFWENHDPTQGMRQGNDVGTQYRSAIYTYGDAQRAGRRGVARRLPAARCTAPATARSRPRSPPRRPFYYAEDYHQQYLAKNPDGYCGIGGTGVACPVGVVRAIVARTVALAECSPAGGLLRRARSRGRSRRPPPGRGRSPSAGARSRPANSCAVSGRHSRRRRRPAA